MKQKLVIVKYNALTAVAVHDPLEADCDRAVTEYKAFLPVGALYAERVRNPLAIDAMLEVVEQLQAQLLIRKAQV